MTLPQGASERRRYFRIDDQIRLRYQLVTAEQMAVPAAESFQVNDLRSSLARFDTQINHLLSELRIKEPLVGELLVLLNQKYAVVAEQVIADKVALTGETHPLVEVNISACGMAFTTAEPAEQGSFVHLDMILLPTNQQVSTYAAVVVCEKQASGAYLWRLDFRQLKNAEQEVLIQHLVKRQTQLRKIKQAI